MLASEVRILLAFLLDWLLGDPRWLPHPVRLIGRFALRAEDITRRLLPASAAGVVSVLAVLLVTEGAGWGLLRLAAAIHPLAEDAVAIIILYTCFAHRDLLAHSLRVHGALSAGELAAARRQVAMMVGRDTEGLDTTGVTRACVESVAENTVDGVTAPLFYAFLGGPLAALVYKAVSTMDSTFGYKNERYLNFGWAAARLDDLANFLPARLTGLVMVAAARLIGLDSGNAYRIFRRDRKNHASPNSGHSEAAMAGALGVQLGGRSHHGGMPVDKPLLGDALRPLTPGHILQANRLLTASTALILLAGLMLKAVFM